MTFLWTSACVLIQVYFLMKSSEDIINNQILIQQVI